MIYYAAIYLEDLSLWNTMVIEIWGNACNVYLDPLVKLQKKCLGIITFSSYLEHTEPLFQNLEILNFKQLVIHRIAMLMFKNSKKNGSYSYSYAIRKK